MPLKSVGMYILKIGEKKIRPLHIKNIFLGKKEQEQAYCRAAAETVARKPIEHFLH